MCEGGRVYPAQLYIFVELSGSRFQVFIRHLLQFVQQYKPTIIILVETRVSSIYIDYILTKTSYTTNYVVYEACVLQGYLSVMGCLLATGGYGVD